MDREHARVMTESGDRSRSASESPSRSPAIDYAEDLDDNFGSPIIIHLARNKTFCTCGEKCEKTVSESDMSSPGVVRNLEATPAQNEPTAHKPCLTQMPTDNSPSVLQSPESSVDSDEFYTPEISQEIFPTQSPNFATIIEKENVSGLQRIQGPSPHDPQTETKVTFPLDSASEASTRKNSPLALNINKNDTDSSTTSSMDNLEVYWRQAHHRLVSSILDIPSDAFDPFMSQDVPGEMSESSPASTQFVLSIPPKDCDTSHESLESPLIERSAAAASEPVNLASLWIPPSSSQTLPHTPDRPNWALAPDEISPTPLKSTGSQRRSKNRSTKSERQGKDANRWLTPSPFDVQCTLNLPNIRRHLDTAAPEANPDFADKDVIAIFSPRKQTTMASGSSLGSSHNVMGDNSRHLSLPDTDEDVLAHRVPPYPPPLPVLSVVSPAQGTSHSNAEFFQERHAELLRQNQALVALLRSHYQYPIETSTSPHRSPQYARESPPLGSSPAEVHHAIGPNMNEKGFQRSRTTVSPSNNSNHKLKRRAAWRKSVSLPTISETTVGSAQSTPSYYSPVRAEQVSVPYSTSNRTKPPQDPILSIHDVAQMDHKAGGDIHPRHNQIQWPSRSEEITFHERAHPTVSWHDSNSGLNGRHSNRGATSASTPSGFGGPRLTKPFEYEGLTNLSLADPHQYPVPPEATDPHNWHTPPPIEDMRMDKMAQDQTLSDSHPKGRNDSSRSSGFMSNIPIAVRLQRKSSFIYQHVNETQRTGDFASPLGYTGQESKVPQNLSNWPPKIGPGTTKITSDWRQQNSWSSTPQELKETVVAPVDHRAKPVIRTRSLQGLNNQQDGAAAAIGSTTSPSTAPRSRFAAPPQNSLSLFQAAHTDHAVGHVHTSDGKRMKPEQRSDFNSCRFDPTGSREHAQGDGDIASHSRRAREAMRSSSGSISHPFRRTSSQNPSSTSNPTSGQD